MNFFLFLALAALSSSFMVYCSLVIGLLELISWKGKPELKVDRRQRGAMHTQCAKEMNRGKEGFCGPQSKARMETVSIQWTL